MGEHPSRRYHVVWEEPGRSPVGSMPVGNGDIGLNVWVEEDGDLLFYIGKTDAWSESGRLLKLGRVRVCVTSGPFRKGQPFRQELDLESGSIRIEAGEPGKRLRIRLWVDANAPVIYTELDGDAPIEADVSLEIWRKETVRLEGASLDAANLGGSPEPVIEHADTVAVTEGDAVVWYHRNEHSVWPGILMHQGLERLLEGESAEDPLLHRTFGGIIRGTGLAKESPVKLATEGAQQRVICAVSVLTAQNADALEWLAQAESIPAALNEMEYASAWERHQEWWRQYWDCSRIDIRAREEAAEPVDRDGAADPAAAAYTVSRGYALQRFMNACGGRGAYPIKFNGSIFTFDMVYDDGYFAGDFDPDFRRWGGGYWFQNTRLPYWAMIASGDYELMKPLFRLFYDALPLAQERTQRYFGHGGAYFPETMSFWGAYLNPNYGWDREGKPLHHIDNTYIRHYVQNNLELSLLMLIHYEHTGDQELFDSVSFPVIEACLRFFELHYPLDESGRQRFEPAQALENWHEAANPLPEIAGLRMVLERLLKLPDLQEEQRFRWTAQLERLPGIPEEADADGQAVFAPAEQVFGEIRNTENVELYSIFPYRFAAVGTPELEKGARTFERRRFQKTGGWRQDAVQAAYLGLTETAREYVVTNFSTYYKEARFPAFWGPNFDWLPDQDHGSVANLALQSMLLQTDGNRILLCPAWPTDWDADFKLHAPYGTVVEGSVQAGKLVNLKVTPEHRRKDIEVLN